MRSGLSRTASPQTRSMSALVVLAALAGCVSVDQPRAPQLEWEGRVAARGVEVQQGAQAVLTAADAANQAGVVSDTDLEAVARLGLRIGSEGERLAIVLAAIDASRDPMRQAVGIGQAQILVAQIQTLTAEFPELPPAVQAAIVALETTLSVLASELTL